MALTVKELIAELSKVEDQDLPVWAEGCTQCVNPVTTVEIYQSDGHDGDGSRRVWLNVDHS